MFGPALAVRGERNLAMMPFAAADMQAVPEVLSPRIGDNLPYNFRHNVADLLANREESAYFRSLDQAADSINWGVFDATSRRLIGLTGLRHDSRENPLLIGKRTLEGYMALFDAADLHQGIRKEIYPQIATFAFA